MRPYVVAWVRGVSILALYFCLSLVVGALGFIAQLLPLTISVPLLILVGPVLVFYTSRWLAPDLVNRNPVVAAPEKDRSTTM